ncbi:MAG TPA: peptide ABC transporter substrate-binding protein [Candidatus Limnocylindrales bacterium]
MSLWARKFLALGATGALVLSACGGGTASTAPSESTAPSGSAAPASESASASAPSATEQLFNTTYTSRLKQGTPGGTVIIAEWQQVDTLNYYYAGAATDTEVLAMTNNGLTNVTDDFKYVPDLAVDIPTLDNGGVKVPGDNGDAMTTTWKLRTDTKWSDGSPITCDDVQYTWQWNMDKDNTGLYGGTVGWEDIKGIDCPDPTTVVIHWKNIYEGYISLVATVLPKSYMSKIAVKDAASKSYPLSADIAKVPFSGPYTITSIAKDLSQIELTKNPNYVSPKWDGSHPAYLDKVIFKYYSDADAMIAGYKAGEYDIAQDLNDADLPKLADLQASNQVVALTGLTYEFLRPNWASKVMGDPAMRNALKFAVDKDAINTRLLGGNADPAYVNVSPKTWYYDSTIQPYKQDLAQANSILDQAGWTKGSDGIRSKGGTRASITLCTTTRQVRQDTLALVAGWLKQVGIESKVVPVKSSVIFAAYTTSTPDTQCNLAHGTFDVAEHAFVVPVDPLSNYATYYSTKTEPNGSNDAKVNDPVIDKALDDLKGTVDPSVIIKSMADFQQEYLKAAVETPLYYRKEVYIVSPKLQNFTGNPTTASAQWNIQDWFLTQ